MNKVVTVLVTYNPEINSLKKNLETLYKQSFFTIICNNSISDIPEFLIDPKRSRCVNLGRNLGIAAAQSIGMKIAFNDLNADFVLQMDQDSIPDELMVSSLLTSFSELNSTKFRIGLIGVIDYDVNSRKMNLSRYNRGLSLPGTECKIMHHTLSSGSLIPKEAYQVVGGMDDGLFIDGVDSEYCWRLAKHGFHIVLDPNAKIFHRSGDGKKKIFGFLSVGVPTPLRHYYSVRNILILGRRNYVPLSWKLKNTLGIFFKLIVYPWALGDGKLRFKFIIQGIYDGIKNKTGSYRHE